MLEPISERRPLWQRLIWPAAIVALGFLMLPLDLPVARWFQSRCPADLKRVLGFGETYAHGVGVAFILLAVFALDPARRILLPRVAAAAFGGGLLADVMKLLVARTRPRDFNLAGSIFDSFGPAFPLGKLASGSQGFPSAHMATAFGLTAALIWLYPRARWLFPLFAIMAGCQRLSSEAHFMSDVVWGAAAGCIAAGLFLPGGLLASWFDRLEAWLASRSSRTDADKPSSGSSGGQADVRKFRNVA
jgi:membrane-associated phospholipid phosphatase